MTVEQGLILGLLLILLVVFALDLFPIENVALSGLAFATLVGLVPPDAVFSGFANPAVVTVAEILLIVAALERSHLIGRLGAWLASLALDDRGLLLLICGLAAGVSVFINNIGAFALMLPVAMAVGQARGLSPHDLLIPLSFSTLLGGLCSLTGTPANLIVSDMLAREGLGGFGFFDFAAAGVPVAAAGLAAVVVWTPRALRRRQAAAEKRRPHRRIVCELVVTTGERRVGELADRLRGTIHTAMRRERRLFPLVPSSALQPGDVLVVAAPIEAVDAALAEGVLRLTEGGRTIGAACIEAVIMPESTLVGSRVASLDVFSTEEARVVAVASRAPRIEGRLADLQLGVGDILYVVGKPEAVREALDEAATLELSPTLELGDRRATLLPLGLFGLGILAAVTGVASPPSAFGAVVLALALAGALPLRKTLAELNWPIILMLATMIPLGQAVATTGAAAALAEALNAALPSRAPVVLVATVLVVAVAITPFVNNATTTIVLGPIAVAIADAAGVPPQGLLIAVALGASTDFLTPFGHHNNTLALGIGGYRFSDFPRAGAPVTAVVLAIAVPAIWAAWL